MKGLGTLKLISSEAGDKVRIDIFRVKSLHLIPYGATSYRLVALDLDGNNFILNTYKSVVEGGKDLSELWFKLKENDDINLYVVFIENKWIIANRSEEVNYLKQKDLKYGDNNQ